MNRPTGAGGRARGVPDLAEPSQPVRSTPERRRRRTAKADAGDHATATSNADVAVDAARTTSNGRRPAPSKRAAPAEVGDPLPEHVRALLKRAVDEAARLLHADGALAYVLDPGRDVLRFAHDAGFTDEQRRRWARRLELPLGTGMFGLAVAERRLISTGDYFSDTSFVHYVEADRFSKNVGLRSLVVAPLVAGERTFGAIGTYSGKRDAFDDANVGLVRALADHAAAAIANALLIEELDQSREELARWAQAERAVREIGARISALRDADEVLQLAVDEAARVLEADGARIDRLDETTGGLYWAYDAQTGKRPGMGPIKGKGEAKAGEGISGRAVREGHAVWTGDYLADRGIDHANAPDRHVRRYGIRSAIAAPLIGDKGPMGTLTVYTHAPDAYGPREARLVEAIAGQAAVSITNARLIAQLEQSRGELAGRAEREADLRAIAVSMAALRDPLEVLQRTVDHAARLLESDESRIDLLDPDTRALHWAFVSGIGERPPEVIDHGLREGEGIAGRAIAERQPVWTDDYPNDTSIVHLPYLDEINRRDGVRSVLAVPLMREGKVLGALSVAARRQGAYGEDNAHVLTELANHAAIAITNARLIEELERSQAAVAERADAERSLREIAAGIAQLRDPEAVLEQVVEDARRLLRSDGAHLTRMSEDRTFVIPVVVAGGSDDATSGWLVGGRFPINGGINGLAAGSGQPVWTEDYLLDERIPHEPDDIETAERLGLRGMAAVPLRAPEGEIMGTLAVSYSEPRQFATSELELLQGLADHAAIALTNTSLLDRLRESEGRYRHLVQNSPDLVLSIDADARLTFLSDTCERLTGWRPEELLGQHFGALVHESSREVAEVDWTKSMTSSTHEFRGRVRLRHKEGHEIPAEFIALGRLDAEGRFAGANGSVRDMTEQDRLERELRESESRFRNLVQTQPDAIWRCDAEGRFTFWTDNAEQLFGWSASELVGKHFSFVTMEESMAEAAADWTRLAAHPDVVQRSRYISRRADGTTFPGEISAIGVIENGRFVGGQGTIRDVSERERLERDLRESEERYRFLVENSPDIVFSTDAEGRYTYYSETVERLTGWKPEDLVGEHFSSIVDMATFPDVDAAWRAFVERPQQQQVQRFDLRRKDGSRMPVEVNAYGMTNVDGTFAGIHGAARDTSERERLERELQDSEARYRYLAQASPDFIWAVDTEGRITFASDIVLPMTGWRPDELEGQHFSKLLHESMIEKSREVWERIQSDPQAVLAFRSVLGGRDGEVVPVEIHAVGMTIHGGFEGAHGTVRDMRRQEQLEHGLRRQAAEIAASEERAHLARELHDSVTQALFSMTLLTRTTEMLLDRDPAAARDRLGALRELQREALAEMRALIFELRPGNLEQDGLVHALRTHAAALQGRIGLPIVVNSEVEDRLPIWIEEVLYRIAQEALHNVVKHAGARQVRVELDGPRDGVRLRIEDDGRGFDMAAVGDGHLGLAGMRARAEKVGAAFEVRSVTGGGTTIEVIVPRAALDAPGPGDPAIAESQGGTQRDAPGAVVNGGGSAE